MKYNTDMDAYLGCIKAEYDAKLAGSANVTPGSEGARWRSVQDQKHNAAVKEVTDVTERFNEQLRAWKAKNVPEKKPS